MNKNEKVIYNCLILWHKEQNPHAKVNNVISKHTPIQHSLQEYYTES